MKVSLLRSRFLLFSILLMMVLVACNKEKKEYHPTPYNIVIPKYFPTALNLPADNPMTVEGIELGRKLFNDTRLCGYTGTNPDSLICCASCHVERCGFDIGTDNPRLQNGRARGLRGTTQHNVMPLCNLVFNREGYLWNGAVSGNKNIEDIVLAAITAEDELAATPEQVVSRIEQDASYRELFRKAFGTEEVTMQRIQWAVAQYVRTLVRANSKFDKYLRGELQLTEQELRGYVLFTTEEGADCFHCHGSAGTPLFTTNLFYNNALDAIPTDLSDRFSVTGNPQDRGAYRAPTLRNIALTAPYMHDGRFNTLDEVLEFYNTGLQYSANVSPLMHHINDGGTCLTPSQIADLKAFLETLTECEN
ncbi:MAG: c-type cytochrome [Bacteroidales bacterium]|nr:c-type cytochrome [Bacteroidales bacterium]